MKQKILIIGGTGIVGKAVVAEALKRNYEVSTIGLEKVGFPKEVNQIVLDRKNSQKFKKTCKELGNQDIILDIFEFGEDDARQTYECFKKTAKHIFILSTVLVYNRSKPYKLPIKSSHELSEKGVLGGYVDHKLDVENFWKNIMDVNWTILRPYHILSKADSLLGCIPDHNRDPNLLDTIRKEKSLALCDGGNIKFNFIDPIDIADIIFKAANNPKTFHKAYNAVNPDVILAKDYYEYIANEIGKKLIIKNKPIKQVWEENKGWQLTTLPHVYDVSDLKKDIGVVPHIPLKKTIGEVIKSYRKVNLPVSNIPVHQRMTLLPRPKKIGWLLK